MAVKFYPIQRGNPLNKKAPKKYYPQASPISDVDIKAIAGEISRTSTVSGTDVRAVLFSLVELLSIKLKQGFRVKLDDFGTFYLSLRGEGAEEADKLTASSITNQLLNFSPDKDVKNALKGIDYVKVPPPLKEEESEASS